ncbi:MAG: M28 family metallopeptidase [Caulobacteraceae bacterium]
MSRISRLFAACAALALTAAAAPPDPLAGGRAWWAHIRYLASDQMRGRLTGSPEYDRAADYVVGKFKAYGLKPAGAKGWLQPVSFTEQRVIAERSSAALIVDGREAPLRLGADMILSARLPQPATIEAPLVFIGYGLSIPKAGHDDFAGQDLKGKILVTVNGGPAELPGPVKSAARSAETWRAAERAGALGIITLPTPKSMDIPWARQMTLAGLAGMYLADPRLQETAGPRFTASFNPAEAEKLFARSGHSFAEILQMADAGRPIPGFPLKVSLKAKVATESRTLSSPNVIGVLPGADPTLAKQYVVVSAHLDHLGVEPGTGRLYNGAMDDASGVAWVLETARTFHDQGVRPKRSVLFVVFTVEEKGLLGSRAFAEHPTVDKAALAADVNMDMPLPLWPLKHLGVFGGDESTLGATARAVAAGQGYDLTPDPFPDRNVFVRTDQFSFVRAGIPAAALKFGFLPGTPEAQIEHDWRAVRYHSPEDNLSQPVDLEAAGRFGDFVTTYVRAVADAPERPRWLPTSPFAP